MQNIKWTVSALFLSLFVVSSGCQNSVLQQWPLISGLWAGDPEKLPVTRPSVDDIEDYPSASMVAKPISSLMSIAEQLESENKGLEAEKTYQVVLSRMPDHAGAHHRLAILADKQKDFATSQHHYKKSLEKLPGSPDLLNDFGYSLFLQKKYDESQHYLQQALNVDPKNRRSLTNLALVQGTVGDQAAAMKTLLKMHSPTTAERILKQLVPKKILADTTDPNIAIAPSIFIEGIQPLPMTDRSSSKGLATASADSIIQDPLLQSSTQQYGKVRSSFDSPQPIGTANYQPTDGKIQQTSFLDPLANRNSAKNVFYRGPNAAPFDGFANSAEREKLQTYYSKALLLGHNVGHEGFLFPVIESATPKK